MKPPFLKTTLFLSLLSLIFSTTKGQDLNELQQNFITHFYSEKYALKTPFYYTKGISTDVFHDIKTSILKSDTLKNWQKNIKDKLQVVDSFTFTEQEKGFILQELDKLSDIRLWEKIKIPNATMLSPDTMATIFGDPQKGWPYFYTNYDSDWSSFLIPVFLRNNQYCLFYSARYCGNRCAEGELAIYTIRQGRWIKRFTLFQWVS